MFQLLWLICVMNCTQINKKCLTTGLNSVHFDNREVKDERFGARTFRLNVKAHDVNIDPNVFLAKDRR